MPDSPPRTNVRHHSCSPRSGNGSALVMCATQVSTTTERESWGTLRGFTNGVERNNGRGEDPDVDVENSKNGENTFQDYSTTKRRGKRIRNNGS